MRKVIKKIIRKTGFFLLFLLVLLLLLWWGVQQPKVQQQITDLITRELSEKLDVPCRIGKVNIRFFRRLLLEDIYLEDQERDTLLSVGRLEGRLSLFSLLGREIDIKLVGLDQTVINLKRSARDSSYNFQFLMDTFTSGTPSPKDTSAVPWRIGIDELAVNDLQLRWRDSLARLEAGLSLHTLLLEVDTFDLARQIIVLQKLAVDRSSWRYAHRPDTLTTDGSPRDSTASSLTFPDLGWTLALRQLEITDNRLFYDNFLLPRQNGRLDAGHLAVDRFFLHLKDFRWQNRQIVADLTQLAFHEQSGLVLQQLSAGIIADEQHLALEELHLQTPGSRLDHHLEIHYDQFADLTRFTEKPELHLDLITGELALADLRLLLGDDLPVLRTDRPGLIRYHGRVEGPLSDLRVEAFQLALTDAISLKMQGRLQGLPAADNLRFDLPLIEVNTWYQGLNRYTKNLDLPVALAGLGRLQLRSRLTGELRDLQSPETVLQTENGARLHLAFQISGLPDIEQTLISADLRELSTRADQWAGFFSDTIPGPLNRLGDILLTGRFTGTPTDFSFSAHCETAAGNLTPDLRVRFSSDFKDAEYNGHLTLDGLAMDQLLADTTYGPVSMTTAFSGRGMSPDSLVLETDSRITELTLRKYTYRDISLTGHLDRLTLQTTLQVKNEHLQLLLNGQADWRDSLPAIALDARLDTADLFALHWYDRPLALSTRLEVDLSELSADAPLGFARLTGLNMTADSLNFQTRQLEVNASRISEGRNRIQLQSELGSIRLHGHYRLGELPLALRGFVDRHFSLLPLGATQSIDSILQQTRFDLTVSLSDPDRLVRMFAPELLTLDTVFLHAAFDGAASSFEITGRIPRMDYGSIRLDTIHLDGREVGRQFLSRFRIGAVLPGPGLPVLHPNLAIQLGRDSLQWQFDLEADSLGQLYGLQGLIRPLDTTGYRLTFAEPFVFSGAEWQIAPGHRIDLAPGYLWIDHLRFMKDEEMFYLQSQSGPTTSGGAPLEVGFARYDLTHLSRLLRLGREFVTGQLDGIAVVDRTGGSRIDLTASQLTIEGQEVGRLSLEAVPRQDQQVIDIASRLDGTSGAFVVRGSYGLAQKAVNLKVDIERLSMPLIDALLPGMIRDSRGALAADLTISGPLEKPDIQGQLFLDTVSTFVEYLQLRYRTQGRHAININSRLIELGELTLLDQSDRLARLNGRIHHDHFEKIDLDLNFTTQAFPFLRTPATDTSLFYGTVLLRTDARIKGPPSLPEVTVNATTLDSTRLFLQPLTEEEAISERSYIIYGTPAAAEGDSIQEKERSELLVKQAGMDLSLLLEVTPSAELQIIIDPTTGERLSARGQAAISVEMDPAGNLRTTGTYVLNEGSYFLNYEGLVKKSFRIQPGSRINLPGDPLAARFDVTAVYVARTPPYALISSQTNLTENEAAQRAARRRMDFEVLLLMSGTLDDLDIAFDLQIPEGEENAVAGLVRNKLTEIRENENELNKQVFGLLFFNSFIPEQSGGQTTFAEAGENLALSSVSSLISSQLNRLASQYVQGVELTFGLESYRTDQPEGATTVTELEVGLTKRLFNDRLSIKVGGNLDVDASQATGAQTAFAGDFVIEYKLTENGNYRVRVFSRPDYDLINGENLYETGAGLMFSKSFGGRKKKKTE